MSQFQQPPNQQWQSPSYQQQFSPLQFMAPPPEPPKKKRGKVGLLILGIIVVLLFACIGTVLLTTHGNNNPATTTSTSTQAATTNTTGQHWTTTHTFSGNGTKKTQTFQVGNDWKIIYSCNGIIDGTATDGILGVSVYGSDNQIVDGGAIDATCKAGSKPSMGETEEHTGGNIYLSIDGTGSWTVTVQELK